MNTTTEKTEAPIDLMMRAFYTYPEIIVSNNSGIQLDEYGSRIQLGAVVGFIAGLKLAGKEEQATELAKQFMEKLEFLSRHEMVDRNWKYPNRICTLHTDGTALGFTWSWWMLPREGVNTDDIDSVRKKMFGPSWKEQEYIFYMHGGLIFHGLQEVLVVNLNPHFGWSIHT